MEDEKDLNKDKTAGECADQGADENKEGADGADKDTNAEKEKDNNVTTLTEEDVLKRIEEQKKVWESEKAEEARLAKLSADEREKELAKKQGEELAKKEAELLHRELTIKAADVLSGKKLPQEAKQFLVGKDEESTMKNIATFEKMFNEALTGVVKDRIKGKTPEKGDKSPAAFSAEEIAHMSPEEINKNWEAVQQALKEGGNE